MPSEPQLGNDLRWEPVLDLEHPRLELASAEALTIVERVEARSLDGRLRVHAEDDHVEQDLQRLLVLAVPTGATECHERLPVPKHDSRAGGCPRTLAPLDDVGMTAVEIERLHAIAERDPGVTGDEDASEEPR